MPSQPPAAPPSSIPRGITAAAFVAVAVGGGFLVWSNRDRTPSGDADPRFAAGPAGEAAAPMVRVLPPRPTEGIASNESSPLHSVSVSQEKGRKVVRIQVVAGGDEIVVDAVTGRLIQTRPSRSIPAPPARSLR